MPNPLVATPGVVPLVSAPNPGDVLPLWNPEIPGEEIQAGRLGIRIRPGSPAAEKVKALEAFGGAERLREMLEELKQIDGTYQVTKRSEERRVGKECRSEWA